MLSKTLENLKSYHRRPQKTLMRKKAPPKKIKVTKIKFKKILGQGR